MNKGDKKDGNVDDDDDDDIYKYEMNSDYDGGDDSLMIEKRRKGQW